MKHSVGMGGETLDIAFRLKRSYGPSGLLKALQLVVHKAAFRSEECKICIF